MHKNFSIIYSHNEEHCYAKNIEIILLFELILLFQQQTNDSCCRYNNLS
jgi:hypothetical protein